MKLTHFAIIVTIRQLKCNYHTVGIRPTGIWKSKLQNRILNLDTFFEDQLSLFNIPNLMITKGINTQAI